MLLSFSVACALALSAGELPSREPVSALGIEGRYVTVNGRPTFLVGQMSAEFDDGRDIEDVARIVDVMMTPFGMDLVVSSEGVIYWGAWNNVVNVREGREKEFRPHQYPWPRSGPGETTFGGPRFDLDQFDNRYFDGLTERIALYNERGLVPVVGIFSEHAIDLPLHWRGHPFHPQNNVNGLGLPEDDALPEFFENDRALAYQESYVRRLLAALDGVHVILAPFGEMKAAPKAYVDRWLRLFETHEREMGRELLVCLSGRREMLDVFAADPAVDLIDAYCYHDGRYDDPECNVPEGEKGIRRTLDEAWRKYRKPVGKLYHKYGYPCADPKSPWADPVTGTDGGGPSTAARDALWAVYESGGFGVYFKMAWARDRGEYLKPDAWSEDIRSFRQTVGAHLPAVDVTQR